jgi:CBS domain-containing protein
MLLSSMPVLEAALAMTTNQSRSALVVDDGEQLVGLVSLQDINRSLIRAKTDFPTAQMPKLLLSDICTRDMVYAYPDEAIADALDRMAARGLHQLPVVKRDNPSQVLGVLEQEGVTLACSLAATREVLRQHLSLPTVTEELSPVPVKQLT